MTLFFILLIALVVYQFMTKRAVRQAYPQLSRLQVTRLVDAPFLFVSWSLLVALTAYALSALTGMIGELFNVDNYISLFGGGWLGMILRFMRSNGFIGDIQEPWVLIQYRGTIEVIYNVTVASCIVCGLALVGFGTTVKKAKVNTTAFLSSYYLTMACSIVSFASIIWGLVGFDNLLSHKLKDMNDIISYFIMIFAIFLACGIIWRFMDIKKFLALPDRETMTWQEVLAKIKINTDKGQKPVEESHIIYITIGLALVISGYVILSTLPVSDEPEPEQYEQVYTGEEETIAPAPVETDIAPVPNDDEICIAILQKYYTASREQIAEWGGETAFETERFIEYTKCLDFIPLTSTQDYDIGDELVVESIEPYANLEHAYIVMAKLEGGFSGVPTCVIMKEEEGTWKIDNISLEPYEKVFFDYSKPASRYYAFPDCGGDVIEEPEVTEDIILPETGDIVY